MVRVSRKWVKENVSEIMGIDIKKIDYIKIWKDGWQTTLSGEQKKRIESKKWEGKFKIIFSDLEMPVTAYVRN